MIICYNVFSLFATISSISFSNWWFWMSSSMLELVISIFKIKLIWGQGYKHRPCWMCIMSCCVYIHIVLCWHCVGIEQHACIFQGIDLYQSKFVLNIFLYFGIACASHACGHRRWNPCLFTWLILHFIDHFIYVWWEDRIWVIWK